jgi:hypothetical protein
MLLSVLFVFGYHNDLDEIDQLIQLNKYKDETIESLRQEIQKQYKNIYVMTGQLVTLTCQLEDKTQKNFNKNTEVIEKALAQITTILGENY